MVPPLLMVRPPHLHARQVYCIFFSSWWDWVLFLLLLVPLVASVKLCGGRDAVGAVRGGQGRILVAWNREGKFRVSLVKVSGSLID